MVKKNIKGGGKRQRVIEEDKSQDYMCSYGYNKLRCSEYIEPRIDSDSDIELKSDSESDLGIVTYYDNPYNIDIDKIKEINVKEFIDGRNILRIETPKDDQCIIIKDDESNIFYINNTEIHIYRYLNKGVTAIVFIAIDKNNLKYILKFTKTPLNEIDVMTIISNFVIQYKYPHFVILYKSYDCSKINDRIINKITFNRKSDGKKYYPEFKKYIETINGYASESPNKYSLLVMEFFDGTVKNIIGEKIINIIEKKPIEEIIKEIKSVHAQMYVSMLILHKCIGYYYMDAHFENFFYKKISYTDNDYFHYEIFGRSIYIKNKGYLIVLGDYGFCSKIDEPQKNNKLDISNYFDINSLFLDDHFHIDLSINDYIKKLQSNLTKKNDEELPSEKDFINYLIENTIDMFYTTLPTGSNTINKKPYIIPKIYTKDIKFEVITYGGGKINKKYIIYNNKKRLVKKDSDKKNFIIYKKSKLYLSLIKGKYKYYNK